MILLLSPTPRHVRRLAAVVLLCAAPGARADSTTTRAVALPPVSVAADAQVEYRRSLDDFPAGSPRHEFAIRRARLTLSGKAHERVALQLGLVGDRPSTTAPVAVLDAFADVELASRWKIRAGQFKYEFDLEGRDADERMPMLDRSFATNLVAGSLKNLSTPSSPSSAFRDRGATLLGTFPYGSATLELAAGVHQGNGRAPDDDSEMAYTLRGRLKARGLTINLGWRACPDTGSSPTIALRRVVDRAWTAGLELVTGPNRLRSELYQRGRTHAAGSLGGVYLLDVVRVDPAVDVFGRVQTVTLPTGPPDDDFWTFGGNAYHVAAFELGGRAYFTRGGRRGDTWLAASYMIRRADDPVVAAWFTSLNDGLGANVADRGELGDVFVIRLQVAL